MEGEGLEAADGDKVFDFWKERASVRDEGRPRWRSDGTGGRENDSRRRISFLFASPPKNPSGITFFTAEVANRQTCSKKNQNDSISTRPLPRLSIARTHLSTRLRESLKLLLLLPLLHLSRLRSMRENEAVMADVKGSVRDLALRIEGDAGVVGSVGGLCAGWRWLGDELLLVEER